MRHYVIKQRKKERNYAQLKNERQPRQSDKEKTNGKLRKPDKDERNKINKREQIKDKTQK